MIEIFNNVDLKPLSTFGLRATGASLTTYTHPATDLPELWRRGVLSGCVHLGAGSNIAFVARCSVPLLKSRQIPEILTLPGGLVRVSASMVMDELVEWAVERSLWGLENLSGIPGTVGGAAVQNIGAYGAEFKDVVSEVEVFDTVEGTFAVLPRESCDYGYRWSVFKRREGRYIVTAATIALSPDPRPNLGYGALGGVVDTLVAESGAPLSPRIVRQAVLSLRGSKLPDPAVVGSVGSFFKNPVISAADYDRVVERVRSRWSDGVEVPFYPLPDDMVKIPAAWLIDRCGWKGRSMGGVAVWEAQPLVLVNATGSASGSDLLALSDAIIQDVRSVTGVTLSPEAILLGD